MKSTRWTILTERNGTFTYDAPTEHEYHIRQLLAPGGWVAVERGGEITHLRTDYIVAAIQDGQSVAF